MKCKSCQYGIYDETWGEYKCKKLTRVINASECDKCEYYKKRKDDK